MNRSRIEWCDHTWNPITGCLHGCSYCYANIMTSRFSGEVRRNITRTKEYSVRKGTKKNEILYTLDAPMLNEIGQTLVYPFGFAPTFHRYRLNMPEKLKMGSNIFVGAMADIFGEWIPDEWLDEIFAICQQNPTHNYLFLTKFPERYTEYGVPIGQTNFWYGTTITKAEEMHWFNLLPAGCNTFVSMEPLLEDVLPEEHNILFQQIDWLILGAETGRKKNKVIPEAGWIYKILQEANKTGLPVFMKNSLIPIVGEANMRREFPESLKISKLSPKVEERLYGECCECGKRMRKQDMITLLARSKRGEVPKQYGFMCRPCFHRFCTKRGLNVPGLEEMDDSITVGPEEE